METGSRIVDYQIDADYIYAGILQCYGIDLKEKAYHWHKVRAMITGMTGTRFNTILEYRSYTGNNKEMLKQKRLWALPEKVSDADKEALERFNAQFN